MDLYSKTILNLNSKPPNYGAREDAQHEVKAYNAYCGDKYKLHLDYEACAEEISFTGYGCAVSKASTAILTECMKERSWQEIHDICVVVLDFLRGSNVDNEGLGDKVAEIDARLESFAVVRKYPGRYECAALCWEEMLQYSLKQIDSKD